MEDSLSKNSTATKMIVLSGLFIALSYLGTMFNITFNVGAAKTMIHFGNVFCLLGALVLGGRNGGVAASLGMGLFDLTNGWVLYAPSTFILKFLIALIAGTTFVNLKIANQKLRVVIACGSGMLFNLIFSPIASYLTTRFIIGTTSDFASLFAAYESIAVVINAVMATMIAAIMYTFLAPALKNLRLK